MIIINDEYCSVAEIKQRRERYMSDLIRHPNCQDPDHPGCEKCDPVESED